MPPSPSANPVPLNPGPEAHLRRFLHDRFEVHQAAGRAFDLDDWQGWSNAEIADTVRALARDYLQDSGGGYDWVAAGHRAEFVMAAHYHDLAALSGLTPAPRLYVNFFDPGLGEGLELELVPPSDIALDPLPGQAEVANPTHTQRARAALMVPPPGDALLVQDMALVTGARQLAEFFQNTHRIALMMMGGALALWKGLQVSHHVRAGAVYRQIVNPTRPQVPAGDMRILYNRQGDHVNASVAARPGDAVLFLE